MEKLMLKHQRIVDIAVALSVPAFASTSAAQQARPGPAPGPGVQCGGQYECVEDRPLTPAEAEASRSHPQYGQAVQPQDPREVAATKRQPPADAQMHRAN